MSLDTVLKIGKAFRASADGLKYFKYIKPCPKDSEKSSASILRLSIPVKEDFTFDFDMISEITDQNVIGSDSKESSLYYLTFKTSDNDGMVKYIFGDIFHSLSASIDKNGVLESGEGGFYRLDNPSASKAYQQNSFHRGEEDFKKIVDLLKLDSNSVEDNVLVKFRNSFESQMDLLHLILKYQIGVLQFLKEHQNEGRTFLEFLNDEKALKNHTAFGVFETIRASKTAKKTFSQLFKIEDEDYQYEWETIRNNEIFIAKLIAYSNSTIFIHFSFPDKEHWYNFKNELAYITQKMLDDFVDKSSSIDGYVLKKTLYKTLCSGDSKNDIQFPSFEVSAKHKSKSFTIDEISDLFYAIDYSKNAVISPTEDIKLIVLPNGDNLSVSDYEDFVKETQLIKAESIINRKNTESKEKDSFFAWFDDDSEVDSVITRFDMILSKRGSKGLPDTDFIEISGVSKSSLQSIKTRIESISQEIYFKREKELKLKKATSNLIIANSFYNVLVIPETGKSGKNKYQSHILKVLPRIYTSNYLIDNLLLPSFINNVEYSIRHGEVKYPFLKYDFEFLLSIQNTIVPKQNFLKNYEFKKSMN